MVFPDVFLPIQHSVVNVQTGEFEQNWEPCTRFPLMSPYISLHLRFFWDMILKKSPDSFSTLSETFFF